MAKKSQRRKPSSKRNTSCKRKGRSILRDQIDELLLRLNRSNIRVHELEAAQRGPTAPPSNQCGPYDDGGNLGRGSTSPVNEFEHLLEQAYNQQRRRPFANHTTRTLSQMDVFDLTKEPEAITNVCILAVHQAQLAWTLARMRRLSQCQSL